MNRPSRDASVGPAPNAGVSFFAFAILAGVLLLTPWANGGSDSRTKLFVYGGVLAAALAWFVQWLFERRERLIWSWLAAPLAAGIALGLLQLTSWSTAANWSSAAKLRAELLDDVAIDSLPLTLNAAATRYDLAQLVMALVAVVLGANLLRAERSFLLLCRLLALNGAALALFGGVQSLVGHNGKLFGSIATPDNATIFASFVYHNQAGNYLALCWAAAIGWWTVAVRQPATAPRTAASPQTLRQFYAEFSGEAILATVAIIALSIGVLASLSRGAFLAVLASACVTFCVWPKSQTRKSHLLLAAATGVAVLGLLIASGISESVATRLDTLTDQETLQSESRLAHWRDSSRATHDFWGLGAGLGNYRYVYPLYETRYFPQWFYHAHNQYLEALVDGGVGALALVFVAVGVVALACRRLLRGGVAGDKLFALVGLLCLVMQVVHAGVDYVLYLPANLLTFAVICGAVCGRSAERRAESAEPAAVPSVGRQKMPAIVTCLLLLCAGRAYLELYRSDVVVTALAALPWRQGAAEVTAERLETHRRRLEAALATLPDHAEGQEALAEIWRNLYQLQALAALSAELNIAPTDENLQEWTSPLVLHSVAHGHRAKGETAALAELRTQETVQATLRPSLDPLQAARRACPLLSQPYVRLAETSYLLDDADAERRLLQKAGRVAPGDAELLYEAGRLAFSAARYDEAYDYWRRSLAMSHRYIDDIRRLASEHLSIDEIIARIYPPSAPMLIGVARHFYAQPDQAKERQALLDRAAELLPTADLPPDERLFVQGALKLANGQPAAALDELRQAVRLRPADLDWRYELAQALYQAGHPEEAEREALFCVRMRSYETAFNELLQKIRDQPQIKGTSQK